MKQHLIIAGALLLAFNIDLKAQGNEVDAFTLSNTELNGTARSMAMAGAFGALGGNVSVISANPAGLGIYRSSDASFTFDVTQSSAETNWNKTKNNNSKTALGMDNFGVSIYFPTSSGSVLNWNLGLSYNRLKNYKRNYKMETVGQQYSLSDYIASRTSNAFYENGQYLGIAENALQYVENQYDPYYEPSLAGQWLSVLGYESWMIGPGQNDGDYYSEFDGSVKSSLLSVQESGNIDEFCFGLGTNISNVLFLGASMSISTISYQLRSDYEDLFSDNDHLYLQNYLTTEGDGFSFNIGAIVNLEKVRLGVAFNTPKYYRMSDYYNATAGTYNTYYDDPLYETETPADQYSEYEFRSPGKWIFSGALILGSSALLSVDYELQDYKQMRFSDRDGNAGGYVANDFIAADYTWAQTLKIGGELKPTPQFAVRAGYIYQTSPMLKQLYDNTFVEGVFASGTIPHFTTVSKPVNYITAGLGYRFTPNFYMDLAAVYRHEESKAYAFSNTGFQFEPIKTDPASLLTKSTRIALSLGYKF